MTKYFIDPSGLLPPTQFKENTSMNFKEHHGLDPAELHNPVEDDDPAIQAILEQDALMNKLIKAKKALDVQIAGNHYKNFKIQPIEFILGNGIGFIEGNVIKYVCRWKSKGGVDDLRKARHYLDLLIEHTDVIE